MAAAYVHLFDPVKIGQPQENLSPRYSSNQPRQLNSSLIAWCITPGPTTMDKASTHPENQSQIPSSQAVQTQGSKSSQFIFVCFIYFCSYDYMFIVCMFMRIISSLSYFLDPVSLMTVSGSRLSESHPCPSCKMTPSFPSSRDLLP